MYSIENTIPIIENIILESLYSYHSILTRCYFPKKQAKLLNQIKICLCISLLGTDEINKEIIYKLTSIPISIIFIIYTHINALDDKLKKYILKKYVYNSLYKYNPDMDLSCLYNIPPLNTHKFDNLSQFTRDIILSLQIKKTYKMVENEYKQYIYLL